MLLPKISSVIPQHRLDALCFVIGRDQEQQARLYGSRSWSAGGLECWSSGVLGWLWRCHQSIIHQSINPVRSGPSQLAALLDAQLAVDAKFLDALAQGRTGDAEQLRGMNLVPTRLFERLDNQLALDGGN